MDSETPLNVMQRVVMGYDSGILTLNQALETLNLPLESDGDERKDLNPIAPVEESEGDLPDENTQPGAVDVKENT